MEIDPALRPIDIGQAKVLREGKDLLIIAAGSPANDALDAADTLAKDGIEACVVNARFVKPLDSELFVELASTIKKVITVEEHVLAGGFGSAVLEMFADHGICDLRVKRIGIRDTFVEHGGQDQLRADYGVDAPAIVDAGISLYGKE